MTHPDAKAEHLATFDVARGLIAQHDGIRHELVQALRLQAEADRAADVRQSVPHLPAATPPRRRRRSTLPCRPSPSSRAGAGLLCSGF